ncbi:hypothetical protein LIER_20422 [Lithospermum erythrorhizon]|uniref:Uncharacterized protein n=1 Tax=Lithospermum erythrorhizon TaxID=34254 RepID=A0AAV3QLG5_LITER
MSNLTCGDGGSKVVMGRGREEGGGGEGGRRKEGGVGVVVATKLNGERGGGLGLPQLIAIGLLGRDPENVEQMIHVGVCGVFAKILKEGPMKVQTVVAWAVSELAEHYLKCQELFAQQNTIRLLVSHLAFETIQEHIKYAIVSKTTSIHEIVLAKNSNSSVVVDVNKVNEDEDKSLIPHPLGNKQNNQMHNVVANTIAMKGQTQTQKPSGTSLVNHAKNNGNDSVKLNSLTPYHQQSLSGASNKAREIEDPATKVYMKAMAARAIWQLAKGNSAICRNITESRALLCLAVLLEE